MMRVCYYGWNLIILLSNALLAVTVIKQEHYFEMSDLNCILTGVGVRANESGCVYFSAWLRKAIMYQHVVTFSASLIPFDPNIL